MCYASKKARKTDSFALYMKEADLARVAVEQQCLQLYHYYLGIDREASGKDRPEQQKERKSKREKLEKEGAEGRKERHDECKEDSRLGMKKFKIMLDSFVNCMR